MSLANIFYIIGIVSMTLYTIFLIVIVVLLFYIKKKVTDAAKIVEEKFHEAKELVTNPGAIAATVGTAVVETAINKATKFVKSKTK